MRRRGTTIARESTWVASDVIPNSDCRAPIHRAPGVGGLRRGPRDLHRVQIGAVGIRVDYAILCTPWPQSTLLNGTFRHAAKIIVFGWKR